MPNRAFDWLNQAIKDLKHAEESRCSGHHEWACFAAQQAGEKAIRALRSFAERGGCKAGGMGCHGNTGAGGFVDLYGRRVRQTAG